jgi:hypothetical protein
MWADGAPFYFVYISKMVLVQLVQLVQFVKVIVFKWIIPKIEPTHPIFEPT